MADSQALQTLRDIHLPEPVGFWPLAPGWYVLAFIILLLIAYAAWVVYCRACRGRAKHQALLLLADYEQQYAAGAAAHIISARTSELLRRVALAYYPRARVAGLHGDAWVAFLNDTSNKTNFNDIRALIVDLPYQNEVSDIDLQPLFTNAKAWIKQRGTPCLN